MGGRCVSGHVVRKDAVQGLGKCSGTYPQLPSSSWITPLSGKQGKEGKCQPYCLVSHSRWGEDPSIIRRPGALTICMDNPEIPGRIQMERFIPVECFRKKKKTFRGITFFPFLPKRSKFSVPFVWMTSTRLHVERKWKFYRYFVNGATQSRSCFRCQ